MSSRFTTLDAARGVAALVVALYHLALAIRPGLLPHAYIAVDFFFMLSGFVLWEAYAQRLLNGLSPTRFMLMRLVRFYPLFAVGALVGALGMAVLVLVDPARSLWTTMSTIILNLLMLPSPSEATLFPANPPAWSLFQELLINGVFAVALVRISARRLALVVWGLGALYLWAVVVIGNANLGDQWSTLLPGLARSGFGFSLGLLIAQRLRHEPAASPAAILAPIALALVLCAPGIVGPASRTDVLCVFLLLPLLLWLSARWQLPAFARRAGAFLGEISYPLYAIHFPLLQATLFVARRIHVADSLAGVLYLPGVLAASYWLARAFDRPARSWVSKRLGLRMSAQPAATMGN